MIKQLIFRSKSYPISACFFFFSHEAEKKFQAWLDDKAAKVDSKKDSLAKVEADTKAKALEAEKEANEARIAAAAPIVEEEPVADESEASVESVESESKATGEEE